VFAGEHLSDAYYGYMNGGAETGRLAAQVVLRRIERRSAADTASPARISGLRAAG
jgi:monoamine oxidase